MILVDEQLFAAGVQGDIWPNWEKPEEIYQYNQENRIVLIENKEIK